MQLVTNYTTSVKGLDLSKVPIDDKQTLRDLMGEIMAKTVQDIARDYEYRLNNYKSNVQLLNGGLWYHNTYFKALKETNQTDRLDWFRTKDRFFHVHPPSDFELIPSVDSPSGYERVQMIMKKNAIPSDALASARKGLGLVDCGIVCQIGQYQALHDIFGKEKFNKLFNYNSSTPLMLSGGFAKKNPLFVYLAPGALGKREKGNRPILKGQLAPFVNQKYYSQKHNIQGSCGSFNTACLLATPGNQRFVGLGLPSHGVSESQIEQIMLDDNNEVPCDLEELSDQLVEKIYIGGKAAYRNRNAYFQSDNDKIVKFNPKLLKPSPVEGSVKKQLQKLKILGIPRKLDNVDAQFGYDGDNILDFNIELIQTLIQTPLEKISQEFVFSERERTIKKLMHLH